MSKLLKEYKKLEFISKTNREDDTRSDIAQTIKTRYFSMLMVSVTSYLLNELSEFLRKMIISGNIIIYMKFLYK